MFKIPDNLLILFKRLFIILMLYAACRLLFYFFNRDYFNEASFGDTFLLFIYGMRFDLFAIGITNMLFIFMHFFPYKIFYHKIYQLVLRILFYSVNITAVIFNSIDFIYFKFTNKRTTAELFKLFGLGEDMGNTIPVIIADFWYILVMVAVMFVIAGWFYNKIRVNRSVMVKPGIMAWLYSVPMAVLLLIACRGGVQYVPLSILSASVYATPRFTSLVLNTPFTILKTVGKAVLSEKKYFSDAVLEQTFSLRREPKGQKQFVPYNVVVIIMESFSKEYVGSMNHQEGYTPFLDSMMKQSLVFTNAFANGKKSMEGIPAVLAGMPQLMPESYITSPYNGDELVSLASLLKKKNYVSWFFHGGINGTMGFDRFTKMAGFEHYVGRNEYPDKRDFDGTWGIYDEPFFRFFAEKLSGSPQPFVAGFFSLSSHHPYTIPDSLKHVFRKGPLPIQQSIVYADHSLKRFFEKAQQQPWFSNTLFVITADHTGPAMQPFYQSKTGMYAVPLLFYMPGKIIPGSSSLTCQQADIMPSIMDLLGYDLPFNSFGTSVFDSTAKHIAFTYQDNIYQLMQDGYVFQFDGTQTTGLYHYFSDSTMSANLADEQKERVSAYTRTLQGVIQQYNTRLLNNTLAR